MLTSKQKKNERFHIYRLLRDKLKEDDGKYDAQDLEILVFLAQEWNIRTGTNFVGPASKPAPGKFSALGR